MWCSVAAAGGGGGRGEGAAQAPRQPHWLLRRGWREAARRRVHAQRHPVQASLPLYVLSGSPPIPPYPLTRGCSSPSTPAFFFLLYTGLAGWSCVVYGDVLDDSRGRITPTVNLNLLCINTMT
jgi:hypothetical protein